MMLFIEFSVGFVIWTGIVTYGKQTVVRIDLSNWMYFNHLCGNKSPDKVLAGWIDKCKNP